MEGCSLSIKIESCFTGSSPHFVAGDVHCCDGPNDNCCSNGVDGYCGEGEGDCDSDRECAGALECVRNGCEWGRPYDCCLKPGRNLYKSYD